MGLGLGFLEIDKSEIVCSVWSIKYGNREFKGTVSAPKRSCLWA
jgi:hypothetical protein